MKTQINKWTKNNMMLFFSISHSNIHVFNTYCCLSILTQTHSACHVQRLTVKYSSQQMNCTYGNYTQATAKCSAAQQHSTYIVQILYKLYSIQLNCTYSNYTQLLLHVQQHNSTAHLLYKYCTNYSWTVLTVITHSCCCCMFNSTTAQHIYCTNTVQTTVELYLQ
jgi:hypothetical protein